MFHAVIPAGGSGTRLWPLSRAGRPKFLLPLTGTARSLLQATIDRLTPLAPPDRTLIVTGAPHVAAVAAQVPELPGANLLAEPSPRDSGGAIGLAAAVIARRDPDAVMGSFAADHLIRDPAGFTDTVRVAIRGAEAGWLMTVGMRPTYPETGFGYVQCGRVLAGEDAGGAAGAGGRIGTGELRQVLRFKEKPDHRQAAEFVASGDFLWNASMFVWRVDVFLAELARQQPALHDGLTRVAAAWDTPRREQVLADVWPTLPRLAVEYAVMEGAAAEGKVATVSGDFGWSDVGDFRNLAELIDPDESGSVVLGGAASSPDGAAPAVAAGDGAAAGHGAAAGDGAADAPPPVLLTDSRDVLTVPAGGRMVTVLGLRDVVVVDTPDAVLVCARDRAQDVKQLVDELKTRGHTSYL